MQTYLKTRPVWIQLLLFIGMALVAFSLVSAIGTVVLAKATGISVFQLQNVNNWDPNNPHMMVFVRGILLLQFIGLWLFPSVLFAFLADRRPLNYLGLHNPGTPIYWVLGAVAMLAAIPLVEYTGILNQQMFFGGETQKWVKSMEEEASKQIQFMLSHHTPKELVLNLIFISLFAGIGEELFFRGVLQRLLIWLFRNAWAGIILTAIIFSAFHLQFFGFIPRFLLGLILGLIYWYSGSLWTAMLAHFIYDGLFIVVAYFQPNMVKDTDATLTDPAHLTLAALLSLVATVFVVRQIVKRSRVSYVKVYREDQSSIDEFSF